MNLTRTRLLPLVFVAAGLGAAAPGARADALHACASAGAPDTALEGVPQPLSSRFALHTEVITYDSVARDSIDDTSLRSSALKSDYSAVLMDWYFAGRMRLTNGLSVARSWLDLRTIGNHSGFILRDDATMPTANERAEASPKWPATASILGFGYGANGGSGASVRFDLSGSPGRLGIAGAQPGPPLGGASQADLDRELALLRENVARVRLVPQVSLGMSLKF